MASSQSADFPDSVHSEINATEFANSGKKLGTSSPTISESVEKVSKEINATQDKVGTGSSDASSASDGDALTKQADGSTAWESTGVSTLEGKTLPYTGGTPMGNPNLAAWYADLDTADTETVDLVVVGDSITEYDWVNGFWKNLAHKYNSIASTYTNPIVTFQHTNTTALFNKMTSGGTNSTNGYAALAQTLSNGQTATKTVTCDGLFVLWGEGTGTLTVKDGGSGGTTVATIDTSTGDGASNITSIDLTTYASHSIYIESTGDTILEGIQPTVGNRTKGVRVWRCAKAGYNVTNFNNSSAISLDFIEKLKTFTGKDPHVLIQVGYNESVATYPAALTAYVGSLNTIGVGSIGVWIPWGNPATSNTVAKPPVIRSTAEGLNCAVIDAYRTFGDMSNFNDPYGLSYDGTHPNTTLITYLVAQMLMHYLGDPIGVILSLISTGSMTYTGTFTGNASTATLATTATTATTATAVDLNLTTNGRVAIVNLFGFAAMTASNSSTDANSAIAFSPKPLASALGYPEASIALGAGGSTALDFYMSRASAGVLGMSAGGAAASVQAKVSGTLNSNTTAVGNVGTGEDNLISYSLPASVLNTNGHAIRVRAAGTIANNANSKTLKFYFGSTAILTASLPTSVAASWVLEAEIIRTGAATQEANATLIVGNGASYPVVAQANPTQTLTSATTIKCTGEATANNDIIQESMRVRFEPA